MPFDTNADELSRYPLTGRFLMGRARHAMREREKKLIESLVERTERFDGAHTVLERGVRLDVSTMLIEGTAARVMPRNRGRHIVALHVPGDFVDLHAYALKRLDHDLVTVGPSLLGFVPHERLSEILRDEPHLARLLWFSTLLDAAIHREWIVRLEELTAEGRLAHLLSELWHRLELVGLGEDDGFDLPLSQIELSNACGTTTVHMNRTVRALREAGVAEIRRGRVNVPDRARLEKLGKFDPAYLYGEGELRVGEELSNGL
jgi:CRP-like cAMP-binding protein